jgi:hypothetical protein
MDENSDVAWVQYGPDPRIRMTAEDASKVLQWLATHKPAVLAYAIGAGLMDTKPSLR